MQYFSLWNMRTPDFALPGIQSPYFSMLCFSEHWKSMWQDSREHRRMGALCFAVRPAGSDRKLLWMQQKGICSKLISFRGVHLRLTCCPFKCCIPEDDAHWVPQVWHICWRNCAVSVACSSLLVCTCVLAFTKMTLGIKNTNRTIGVFMIFGVIKSWQCFLQWFLAESLCCFSRCSLIHEHISLMNRLFLMTRHNNNKTSQQNSVYALRS